MEAKFRWCDLMHKGTFGNLIIITIQQLNSTGMKIISEWWNASPVE